MNVNDSLIKPYLHYIFPEKPTKILDETSRKWKEQSLLGQRDLSNYFVHLNDSGKIVAAAHINASHPDYHISLPTRVLQDTHISFSHLIHLLTEAMNKLRAMNAKIISFRLVEVPHLLPLSTYLSETGFNFINSRIEYKTDVHSLPDEDGTPLKWSTVSEDSPYNRRFAAKILENAGDGDPEWGVEDHNLELLESYLENSQSECLQIGFFDDQPSAIILVQVENGWSTISYMALLPEFRRRGIGKWVHRRGFTIMRKQGGHEYHGGTDSNNKAMQALFEKHHCLKFRSLQEWRLTLSS